MNHPDAYSPHKNSSPAREWLLAVLSSLGVALAIVAPFFWLANPSGHDIAFHASSWLDAAAQWKEGILFPRWTEWANYGYGEPRFIFYPTISWILGGALITLLPIKAVVGTYVVLAQTLAGTSAYALVRKFASRGAALAGAACFAANPDALLVIYVRSDYAELLAIAFYPLLILATLQLCGLFAKQGTKDVKYVMCFALTFAAIWLTNAPAAVIASYSAVLLLAWAAVAQRSWKPAVRGAAGIGLGLGLAAFYWIPAAYEQRWVKITQALSTGLAPRENFLFTTIADADHNHFNRVASAMALLTMFFIVVFALRAWQKIRAAREFAIDAELRKLWMLLVLLAAAASLLMVKITLPLWAILPKLRFVQFPWRWMSMLAVVFSAFAAWGLTRQKRSWLWLGAVFVLLAGSAVYLGKNTWWDADDFPSMQYEVQLGHGFEGTDEYDPLGDDHLDLAKEQPRARFVDGVPDSDRAQITVRVWTAERRLLDVQTQQPERLALRLLDYPAWRVTVNGEPIQPGHLHGVRAIVVPLPAGHSVVRATFTRTMDRTIGGLVSTASLLILGFLWFRLSIGSAATHRT